MPRTRKKRIELGLKINLPRPKNNNFPKMPKSHSHFKTTRYRREWTQPAKKRAFRLNTTGKRFGRDQTFEETQK